MIIKDPLGDNLNQSGLPPPESGASTPVHYIRGGKRRIMKEHEKEGEEEKEEEEKRRLGNRS